MWNRRVGARPYVTLVVHLFPQSVPRWLWIGGRLQSSQQGPKISRSPISSLQLCPSRIVEAQHVFYSHTAVVGLVRRPPLASMARWHSVQIGRVTPMALGATPAPSAALSAVTSA